VRILVGIICIGGGLATAIAAILMLVGAGTLRQGPSILVALIALSLVMLPARALAQMSGKGVRPSAVARGMGMLVWSLGMMICFPLYFPGERASALSIGLASVEPWTQGKLDPALAHEIDEWLPSVEGRTLPEPAATERVAKPPPVAAKTKPTKARPAKPVPVAVPESPAKEVVLPTEGRSGSLKIPVTVEGQRASEEITMIFDTGATLTTLNRATLRKIGIRVPTDAPKMKVHTAAGPRETQVVLVPRLWVGGFEVEGVSIAVCDACATGESVGLLGLNVSERFLVTVDGAREELVLASRTGASNRGSDVAPWVELEAEATRWPDGRTEVILEAENTSDRWIDRLTVAIQCDQTRFADLREIGPKQIGHVEVSIEAGTNCESFQVSIDSAVW
jgi:clan AA aspartic protease (TIGR02281 family)